jgi:flagellar hook assembly protein FlgD
MWYNYFAGDSIDVVNVSDVISLEPGEYRIYTDVKLAKPEIGLGSGETVITGKINTLVYPNPSNGEFNISFVLDETSNVELNILDLNGGVVSTLFSGRMEMGRQSIRWNSIGNNGHGLSKGMYFAELIINGQKDISKLIIN